MRIITDARNKAAFNMLAVQASLFADHVSEPTPKRKRQKRLEVNAARLEHDLLEVDMPSIELVDGRCSNACKITFLRPILPTDSVYIEASVSALASCIDMIAGMHLADEEPAKEELPLKCWWDGVRRRYITTWYKEDAHKWCFKTFRATSDSNEARENAKGRMYVFIENDHTSPDPDHDDDNEKCSAHDSDVD